MERTLTPVKISDSEWEVMRVIWTKKETTAQEIIEILGAKMDWKAATIKTLLGRLVKKEALETKQDGKKYIYYAAIDEASTIKSVTENLFAHICAKKVGQTIADLVDEAELTKEDIALIMQQLTEKQPAETIACNCIPGQCQCKHHEKEE